MRARQERVEGDSHSTLTVSILSLCLDHVTTVMWLSKREQPLLPPCHESVHATDHEREDVMVVAVGGDGEAVSEVCCSQ